jgi:hypothetical protein
MSPDVQLDVALRVLDRRPELLPVWSASGRPPVMRARVLSFDRSVPASVVAAAVGLSERSVFRIRKAAA